MAANQRRFRYVTTVLPSDLPGYRDGELFVKALNDEVRRLEATKLGSGSGEVWAIRTVTAGVTLTDADDMVVVNAIGGPVTIVLPAAAGNAGRELTIKKVDSSANAVTLSPGVGVTIDLAATAVIPLQFDALSVRSDGANWWII